jgi:hypothetical protein
LGTCCSASSRGHGANRANPVAYTFSRLLMV